MGFNENTLISIRREDQRSYYNLKTLKSLSWSLPLTMAKRKI